MAETGNDELGIGPTDPDAPAIGLLVRDGRGDGVPSALLRAEVEGYDVFLTHDGTIDPELVEFADALGCEVVLPESDAPDEGTLRDVLSAAAQARAYPGVIFHDGRDGPIDHRRSIEAFAERDAYGIDAVPESEPAEETRTIAAIPAYDEAGTIESVVRAALEHADEVVVVDDGSTDETARLARQAGAIVVGHRRNRGYGAALKTAFAEADRLGCDQLVVLDGDGQHDPRDVPLLLEALRTEDADVVIGSRKRGADGIPLYRRIGLVIINTLTNLSLGRVRPRSFITDTQSGFRAYGGDAVEVLARGDHVGDGMESSVDILHVANDYGFHVAEIPATITYDVDNANSLHPVSHGLLVVNSLLRTVEHEHPILILGLPGLASILVGSGFGYWTVQNYLAWGTFPGGLAISSVFFTLLGIFAVFTAIILHALNHHD